MSNFNEKIGSAQHSIPFQSAPGSCDDDSLVRSLVSAAIKSSGKKREAIAAEMSTLIGRPITAAMLNSFSAGSKEGHRWPLSWTRAFCAVTSDWQLFSQLLGRSQMRVISLPEQQLLDLGRNYLRQKRAAAELSRLEHVIKGSE